MAKEKSKNIHVLPKVDSGWVIRTGESSPEPSIYNTQRDAIEAAREIARRSRSDLIIHRRDGRIRDRDSYGSDPLPPKEPREVHYPLTSSNSDKLASKEKLRDEDFTRNVFINCPYDDNYAGLFKAIVFVVHDIGFRPRCALEASNAGHFRLEKILNIIFECKYGIHDLSRTELDAETRLPRFNMPLELGLDLGCKRFGKFPQSEKVLLILDVEKFRYQRFISDISGQDIYAHDGGEKQVINIVRDWFNLELDPRVTITPGSIKIYQRYQQFLHDLPRLCDKWNWGSESLPFVDYSYAVASWISNNPIK